MTMVSTEDGLGNSEETSGPTANEDGKGNAQYNEDEVEIQATLNDEDMLGLEVTDTWEEEEKDRPRRRSWDRARGRERKPSRYLSKAGCCLYDYINLFTLYNVCLRILNLII